MCISIVKSDFTRYWAFSFYLVVSVVAVALLGGCHAIKFGSSFEQLRFTSILLKLKYLLILFGNLDSRLNESYLKTMIAD